MGAQHKATEAELDVYLTKCGDLFVLMKDKRILDVGQALHF